tara:strand:+ start:16403 stop:16570 length:168 start_codon:yes stop_codon:yes gene_type:complete
MQAVLLGILKTVAIKLVSEKVLIALTLHIVKYLAKKSTNTLDDKLVEEVEKALQQ